MKKVQIVLGTLLLIVVGGLVSSCQSSSAIESIAESHIEANVPDKKDIDGFLKRDLETYFKKVKSKVVAVEYEFLRNGSTQTGISFPKFYVWVKVHENGMLLEEGAVRLAAIEKKRFEITDYLSKAEVKRNLEAVYRVFPRAVGDKIKEKVVAEVQR